MAPVIANDDIDKLKKVYIDVDDVDLFVGGFLERPHQDSILGPTFKCIVGDTFARIKLGDRFFYDLSNTGPNMNPDVRKTNRFTSRQLREIRRTSMARILCDNTETLSEMQPLAFKKVGIPRANVPRPCEGSDIPKVNLAVFVDLG